MEVEMHNYASLRLYLADANYTCATKFVASNHLARNYRGNYRVALRSARCDEQYLELAHCYYQCEHIHFHFLR